MKIPTQIIFVSSHLMSAQHVFNANAFPKELRTHIDACAYRLAVVFLHTKGLLEAIEKDHFELLEALERQEDIAKAAIKRLDLFFIARSDGLSYLSEMQNLLNAFKSYLDVYARLIGKLMKP
jgi:hypothetical protein